MEIKPDLIKKTQVYSFLKKILSSLQRPCPATALASRDRLNCWVGILFTIVHELSSSFHTLLYLNTEYMTCYYQIEKIFN